MKAYYKIFDGIFYRTYILILFYCYLGENVSHCEAGVAQTARIIDTPWPLPAKFPALAQCWANVKATALADDS